MLFVDRDIIQNIPQLVYWIKENQNKPIEELSSDECEILAGCIYGFSYDNMLEKLKLSSIYNKLNVKGGMKGLLLNLLQRGISPQEI